MARATDNTRTARNALISTWTAPAFGERIVSVRKRVGAHLVDRAFQRASEVARLVPSADPARHGLRLVRDVPYLKSGLVEHTLDVYVPLGEPPPGGWPVVFYVHGGAFRSLSKDTHWIMGLGFGRRGFVTVLPNYRLAPQHRFPAALEDTAEALRFTLKHAHEWGGDPSKLVFAGESAGANIITSLTMCLAYERDEPYARVARSAFTSNTMPLAVLGACGVFDVTSSKSLPEKHKLGWFFQDRYREIEEGYAPMRDGSLGAHDLMNPVVLLEREAPKRTLPPFFLPVGGWDHLKDDHARMELALKAHGVDVEAPVYPGEVHAFHAFIFRPNARKCWQDQFDFLHKRGVPVHRLNLTKILRID